MTDFQELLEDIEDGKNGVNKSIPIGIEKLNDFAAFREKMFTLLFSSSGAGKSKLTTEMFLNAIEYHIENPTTLKPKIILFSMERSKKFQLANWILRRIYYDTGQIIYISKLLGWNEQKLNQCEVDLIKTYEIYIDTLLNEYVTIYEGAKTANQINKILKLEFESLGNILNNKYIPNNKNVLPIIIIDHGNLTKVEKEFPTKKQAIDALTEYCQHYRDFYNANILWVAQVNRSVSSLAGNKDTEVEPNLESIRDSGDVGMAVDLAISLYDPLKYKQGSRTFYNPIDFVCKQTGVNYFRSVQVVKSTYFSDSIRVALAFNGFISQFKALPLRSSLTDAQYQTLVEDVLSKKYFQK